MPRIRQEQLQALTLTNSVISDGQRYAADGSVLEGFDPSRLIDQAKIRDLQYQPNGWISRGIINRVDALPEWQADYEGRLFYVDTSDELYLGVGTEPWYILISGNTASGWDAELTVRTGLDGMNWNGAIATQFQTLSYNFSPDGSDLFVYLNGSLQRLDHDYEIVDQRTIRTLRNIEQNDTVTMLVILSNSMLNYATKAWVYEQIQSGGIQHSLDDAYDDGSIVSVDNRNVDFRLQQDVKFVISEAQTGVPLPASNIGAEDLQNGHNWQTRWQSFDITFRSGGNVVGPNRVFLNSPAVNANEVATEVSEALVTAGVHDLFGYVNNNHIGIQSTAVGADISFDIVSGTNALPILGLAASTHQGDDAYSSYHEFGLNVDGQAQSGLADTEKFYFSVNGVEHFITTGNNTTFDQLRSSLDTVLDATGFTATTEGTAPNQDIRITNDVPGLAYPTELAGVSYAGHIEISQVTTNADVNRSLDGKYFDLESIDNSLFGHPKEYYAWYHLDAESEITEITTTAEDSGSTLAGTYLQLQNPTGDYFAWYEVETPQTAGYHELGFTGLTAGSVSGLTQDQSYLATYDDHNGTHQINFTTPPDIQPVAEVTEVETPADTAQSLSGKYWTINSQAGTGYYVWYNIDTPAAPEVTDVTAVADTAQSLSGKYFSVFTPSQQYFAWMRIMTDPGLPEQWETTEVTVSGDTAQSLSGTYFNLSSADGSPYYVWYEMETDPGVTATTEVTEVTTVADSGQSLSSKYFEISTTGTDYYVWYRMQTEAPVAGVAEVTDVIIPGDATQSLSGKYWNFSTPYNDYYVWYRMQEQAMIPAEPEVSRVTFNSNTVADYAGESFRVYNFNDAYDIWFDTTGTDTEPSGLSANTVAVDISAAGSADDIALATLNAINAATTPFTASGVSAGVIDITCNNIGAQTNTPTVTNPTVLTIAVNSAGTDMTPAVYSTNPAPAGRTGVQINIVEDDVNTDVATKTYNQLSLLGDVTMAINGATITITNDDNGAVDDAVDVDAGVSVAVITQGVTSAPAQYSANPNVAGRTGIVVDINMNDTADTIAAVTASELNGMTQFTSSAVDNTVTVETTLVGAVTNATVGDSGFTVNVTQQGLDYVAPTYSTDPAPSAKTGIKVSIVEDADSTTVAEATRAAIDANASFTASRANSVVTITDLTSGPVTDSSDFNTSFGIVVTTQGQDYVAPTYTTQPAGSGTPIQVDITENANAVTVAQAIEAAFNGTAGFSASRTLETVTITNDVAGVATDAADVNTGFTISTNQDGYEAYSSVDPSAVGRTGIKVNINENDTAEFVATKTQAAVNANINFTANVSGTIVTITDNNGGAVPDAADVDSGVVINVIDQGTDLIPADLTWGNLLPIINSATTGATWSLTGGDIRLTSNTIGSWSSVVIDDTYTEGTPNFVEAVAGGQLDAPVDGTSSYSSQPAGFGTPIAVPVLRNASAVAVASATQSSIDSVSGFTAIVGSNAGVDDHVVTITNDEAGAVADISDNGTLFGLSILNQGADESSDPSVAGKTGIQININKNDSADAVATATQAAIDVGGEFYVTRLNNVLSIQNDHPGAVSPTTDVNTGFVFTQTGVGEDVKYSLFGANGLNLTLPARVDGIDAIPASTGIGAQSLLGGYNFFTFPKDFAVVINSEPVVEIFFDQACYNSSEIVSHFNTKIADSGITNLEAYQQGGQIGFRTIQTGLAQTLEIRDSLSDALVTLGWTPGTYSGDFGEADPIFEVTALSGTNQILVDADIMPSALGVHSIGSETNKFKEIWAQDAHFDAGTIYIGDAAISEETNEFKFTVDDGVNQFDFFGNTDDVVAPPGAARIGVAGLTGVIPEREGAQPGDPGNLQEMLIGFSKSAGGGKLFPDMSSTGAVYGDPTDLKGFLSEKANGMYFKLNEVVMIESVNREVRVIQQGAGIVEGVDWIWRDDSSDPIGGKSIKYDLTELDANQEPTTGTLADDSFYVKTTGGIKLETGAASSVQVTNDLVIEGDLIVNGDTVTVNTSQLHVEDNIIMLNKNTTGTPSQDSGIEVERGNATNVSLVWDEDTDIWRAGVGANLKAIATRADAQDDNGIATWDSATSSFVTSSNLDYNGTRLYVNGDITANGKITADHINSRYMTTNNGTELIIGAGEMGSELNAEFTGTTAEIVHIGGESGVVAYSSPDNMSSGYTGTHKLTLINSFGNTIMPGNLSGSAVKEINGFGKVYNAVWNDIADFIEVEDSCKIEYGKCYFVDKDFTHKQTSAVCQKGVLGIASDTYGYGLGKDDNKHQLPIAVGGFVLAYINGDVEPGDVLTAGPSGNLVVMSVEDKTAYPERIVATYYKPEPNDDYHGIKVDGRHWVKVK